MIWRSYLLIYPSHYVAAIRLHAGFGNGYYQVVIDKIPSSVSVGDETEIVAMILLLRIIMYPEAFD